MKASDFEVGALVKSYDEPTKRGTVIGNQLSDGDQVVAIEWEDGSLTKSNIDDLKVINSALEAEYAAVQLKLDQAAKLMKEANAILRSHGVSLRDAEYDDEGEELIDTSALFAEIRGAGWSTSSMNC